MFSPFFCLFSFATCLLYRVARCGGKLRVFKGENRERGRYNFKEGKGQKRGWTNQFQKFHAGNCVGERDTERDRDREILSFTSLLSYNEEQRETEREEE